MITALRHQTFTAIFCPDPNRGPLVSSRVGVVLFSDR